MQNLSTMIHRVFFTRRCGRQGAIGIPSFHAGILRAGIVTVDHGMIRLLGIQWCSHRCKGPPLVGSRDVLVLVGIQRGLGIGTGTTVNVAFSGSTLAIETDNFTNRIICGILILVRKVDILLIIVVIHNIPVVIILILFTLGKFRPKLLLLTLGDESDTEILMSYK